jgi:hypothetical protein
MMLNPFDDVEEEDDEDFAEEEPILLLKCNLMVQRKPCCYNGRCVWYEEGTPEMQCCKHFIIVDATEEDLKDLEVSEEN